MKNILMTGACGFIGTNFVKNILVPNSHYNFILMDSLSYAGHLPNIKKEIDENNHLTFIQEDIRNLKGIESIFKEYNLDGVLHFAAESHVDRSIQNPNIFFETNGMGTLNLLQCSLKEYQKKKDFRYLQVSTDEVYGHLCLEDPPFTEETPITPRSPYSSSKAAGDLLVQSFFTTYGLPTLITRCSNNYGPYQYPEKLIPLMIDYIKEERPLPVYGKGENIRDWIYVDDHNEGVWQVFTKGRLGEVYNLGGNSEMMNIDIVKKILASFNKSEELISFVQDRLGHDFRYAMNFSKAKKEVGFSPKMKFEEGLKKTIRWYNQNSEWVKEVKKKASSIL